LKNIRRSVLEHRVWCSCISSSCSVSISWRWYFQQNHQLPERRSWLWAKSITSVSTYWHSR